MSDSDSDSDDFPYLASSDSDVESGESKDSSIDGQSADINDVADDVDDDEDMDEESRKAHREIKKQGFSSTVVKSSDLSSLPPIFSSVRSSVTQPSPVPTPVPVKINLGSLASASTTSGPVPVSVTPSPVPVSVSLGPVPVPVSVIPVPVSVSLGPGPVVGTKGSPVKIVIPETMKTPPKQPVKITVSDQPVKIQPVNISIPSPMPITITNPIAVPMVPKVTTLLDLMKKQPEESSMGYSVRSATEKPAESQAFFEADKLIYGVQYNK